MERVFGGNYIRTASYNTLIVWLGTACSRQAREDRELGNNGGNVAVTNPPSTTCPSATFSRAMEKERGFVHDIGRSCYTYTRSNRISKQLKPACPPLLEPPAAYPCFAAFCRPAATLPAGHPAGSNPNKQMSKPSSSQGGCFPPEPALTHGRS